MFYVLQQNLFREYGFKALREHLDRNHLEYEIVKFVPFLNELQGVTTTRKDVFFFGSANGGRGIEQYGWKPGHLINENFTFEKYITVYGSNLLNNDFLIASLESLTSNIILDKFFARPVGDMKEFEGQTFTKAAWLDWIRDLTNSNLLQDMNNKTKVFMSTVKEPIQQEIRCWIVNDKLVTSSQYKIGNRVNYLNMDNNEEVTLFANQIAKIFSPAKAYCLDICLYQDEYKIVELGCINHCGFYDADMSKLIQALERAFPTS